MKQHLFQQQINRLAETFGGQHYKSERINLLWNEVEALPDSWFSKVIDKFIGECRQAPLMPEFREEIAKERERLWQMEKKKNAAEAKEFFDSSYQSDDVRTISQTIIKRLQGRMSDEDYAHFQKMLNNVVSSNPKVSVLRRCKRCDDSGVIFEKDQSNYELVYRCICAQGDKQTKSYARYERAYAST